nr:hypothetical protein Iba_chr01bCG18860 [Ipomoea batatas]
MASSNEAQRATFDVHGMYLAYGLMISLHQPFSSPFWKKQVDAFLHEILSSPSDACFVFQSLDQKSEYYPQALHHESLLSLHQHWQCSLEDLPKC